jgi:hypothetical protein
MTQFIRSLHSPTVLAGRMLLRLSCVLFALVALISSGCSSLVAYSGQDLKTLATRDQVHQEFGEPIVSETIDGISFEEFVTRRKISEQERAVGLNMASTMTGGLIEFIALPAELYRDSERLLAGQTLRFAYDQSGKVAKIDLDGNYLLAPDKKLSLDVKVTKVNE